MFKRRKPDEEPEAPMDLQPAAQSARTEGAGAPDNGLGVPPRPPAPQATATTTTVTSAMMKDPTMGRPPFANPPAAGGANPPLAGGGNPPMPQSAAPRPPGPPVARTGPDRPAPVQERRTLVVGRGISVQGMVQDAERLVVEGTVEATMIHATELSVSPGGVFKGEVEVENAEVAGTIDGTVMARGSLVVRGTGVVLGTARCRRLQVEDGGQITGRIEMLPDTARGTAPVVARSEPVEAVKPVMSYES